MKPSISEVVAHNHISEVEAFAYIVSVVDFRGYAPNVIHQQTAQSLRQVNDLISEYKTDRCVKIYEGYWELENFESNRSMLITWQSVKQTH